MDKKNDKPIYIQVRVTEIGMQANNDNNTRWENYLSLLKNSDYVTK